MVSDPWEALCEELATIADFVRWGASEFGRHGLVFGHGTDNALDEAYAAVLRALHLPRTVPDAYLAAVLTAAERRAVMALLGRRVAERKPLPYLVGEAWFAGLSFRVDERVLIPRSPLAELIESGFAPFVEESRVRRILDIGTGSGCLAVACAWALPQALVDAVDVSADALEVAYGNVERHGVTDRVRCLRSDLFEAVEDERYDIIVSNPPYVADETLRSLAPEFQHEPLVALAGGEEGLGVVRPLLAQAGDHLKEGGILVVEVGDSEDALRRRYPRVPFLWLELERGGKGVFLLTAEQLEVASGYLEPSS